MSANDQATRQATRDHANGTTSDTNKMTPQQRDAYLAQTKKLNGN